MKKTIAGLLFVAGFVSGVVWFIACGSSTNAATPVNASDVTYDGATSGLTATNIQNAIDELVSQMSGVLSSSAIVGTWSGTHYGQTSEFTISYTINNDGSFSCTSTLSYCGGNYTPVQWEILAGKYLHMKWAVADTNFNTYFEVVMTDASNMILYEGLVMTILSKSS